MFPYAGNADFPMLKMSRKSPLRTVRSLCGGDSGKPPGAACSTLRRLPSEARGLMRLCAACTRSAPSPFSSRRNAAVKRTRRKIPQAFAFQPRARTGSSSCPRMTATTRLSAETPAASATLLQRRRSPQSFLQKNVFPAAKSFTRFCKRVRFLPQRVPHRRGGRSRRSDRTAPGPTKNAPARSGTGPPHPLAPDNRDSGKVRSPVSRATGAAPKRPPPASAPVRTGSSPYPRTEGRFQIVSMSMARQQPRPRTAVVLPGTQDGRSRSLSRLRVRRYRARYGR